jgi:hypothetical protein
MFPKGDEQGQRPDRRTDGVQFRMPVYLPGALAKLRRVPACPCSRRHGITAAMNEHDNAPACTQHAGALLFP